MSLKAESICFSQLKGDRMGEAIVCCQYPATGVWQANQIDFLSLNITSFQMKDRKSVV